VSLKRERHEESGTWRDAWEWKLECGRSVDGVWVYVLATLIKGMGMVEEGMYGRKDGPTFH
jgi:hypothetical protein